MSEFRCGNLFRFIFSVFISQPDHLVQEFTYLLAIYFRVYYSRNFIFRFPINYNWNRGWLCSLGEKIRHGGFKCEHMENWMNRAHISRLKEVDSNYFYFFSILILFSIYFSIFLFLELRIRVSHIAQKKKIEGS